MRRLLYTNQWCGVRWLSSAAHEATRGVPRTPDGHNPYVVMDLDPGTDTTVEDVQKQFKKLAVKRHPDQKGGSNELMSELNAAHKIIKQHHNDVIRALREEQQLGSIKRQAKASAGGRRRAAPSSKEEELGRTGGIPSTQKIRDINNRKWKNAKEVEVEWEKLREETTERTAKMISRFELALEQCLRFRKTSMATEITVRERWLRKSFSKAVWEDVHEMRGELLKRGARNLQQSEMAEDMVAFASTTQKKLNDDFTRQAQLQLKAQAGIFAVRVVKLVCLVTGVFYGMFRLITGYWANSFAVKFGNAFFGN